VMVSLTRFSVQEVRSLVERLDTRIHNVASDMAKNNQAQDAKLDYLMAQWQGRQARPPKHTAADLKQSAELEQEVLNASTDGSTFFHVRFHPPPEIPSPASEDNMCPEMSSRSREEPEVMCAANKQASSLECLKEEIQNLAGAEAGVLHEVEKQISTLLSHAALTAFLVEALPQSEFSHEDLTAPKQLLVSPEHIQMIHSAVEEIQHGTRTKLVEAMDAINNSMQVARRTLNRQEDLFHKIKELLPQHLIQAHTDDVMHPMTHKSIPI